jgi:hypothetical protein
MSDFAFECVLTAPVKVHTRLSSCNTLLHGDDHEQQFNRYIHVCRRRNNNILFVLLFIDLIIYILCLLAHRNLHVNKLSGTLPKQFSSLTAIYFL